jgi:hypothetical protein
LSRRLIAIAALACLPLLAPNAIATPGLAFRDRSPEVTAVGLRPFANHAGPVVIYLATEGLTIKAGPTSDATADQSTLCAAAVPAFDHTIFGSQRATVVADLAQKVAKLFAAYDVQVVTTRPASGPYNLVAVGGTAALCKLPGGYSGYAPLDCGDASSSSDVVFVFANGITHLGMLAVIIAHEVGHAHGLPHTDEACDVMSNLLCNPDDKRFFDKSMGITPDHHGRCGLGLSANSHALLLAAIGAPGSHDAGVHDAGGDLGAADAGPVDATPDQPSAADASPEPDARPDAAQGSGGGAGCSLMFGRALASEQRSGQLPWSVPTLLGLLCALGWVRAWRRRRVSRARGDQG